MTLEQLFKDFWHVIVMAGGFVAGYAKLHGRVKSLEDNHARLEKQQETDRSEIRGMFAEIRDDIKKLMLRDN